MEELILLMVLVIGIFTIINMFLYIRLGKKRNTSTQDKLSKISGSINAIINLINGYERSVSSMDNSFRTLVTKQEQKIGSVINQSVNNIEGRIGYMEGRVVNEIYSSSNVIQNSIQQSHSDLSKSFNSRLNKINTELTDLHNNLDEFKNDILRTQAQSFSGMENRFVTIRSEEHRFVENNLQKVNLEQSNISKSIQNLVQSMNNHFDSIKPLEKLLERFNTLYNRLISLDKDILNQEKSLNGMVDKHTKILEYTQELQKTSEEIFNLMKLFLMDSIIKQTTPKK